MRKRTTAVLLSLFAIATVASAQQMRPIARPDAAPATIGEAFQRIRANNTATVAGTKRSRHAIHPNVIYGETADIAFIIPAAGNVAGANGTYFRSDLSIGNFNNADQNVGIGWLQTGVDNTNQPLQFFTIPANTIVAYTDFVGQTLKKSGLGGLVVIAYDATGKTIDQNALVDGFSRIWTPEAGLPNGTVSQSFPAISLQDSEANFAAYALGLRQDSQFRTNVGIVNLDSASHTWTVKALTGAQTQLTVPPFSMAQGAAPAGSATGGGAVTLSFTPTDAADFFWSAYASSTDNVTGDGWVSRATQ